MDIITEWSDYVEGRMLPHITRQMNCLYTIFMVMHAVKGKDYSWHKSNLLLSYIRALLYAVSVQFILAVFLGKSPFEEALDKPATLIIVTISWWMFLFVPYDIFNKIVYLSVGEFQPFYMIVVWFATAHRLVRTSNVIGSVLSTHPQAYAVVLLGIIAGNGTEIVAPLFGEYATYCTDNMRYRTAVMNSLVLTAFGFHLFPSFISHSVVLTGCLVVASFLELSAAMKKEVNLFQPFVDLIRKIVVLKELVKSKND